MDIYLPNPIPWRRYTDSESPNPVNSIEPPWTSFNPRELHSTPVNYCTFNPRELHSTTVNSMQPPWTPFNHCELRATTVNSIQPPWTPCNPSELHSTTVNSIQPPWTPINSPSAQPYIGLSKMAFRPKDTIFRAECMVQERTFHLRDKLKKRKINLRSIGYKFSTVLTYSG